MWRIAGESIMDMMPIQSPLVQDNNGVIRIGKTRVTLLSVLNAYDDGATPEEIVQDFPALSLAEVYTTIAYYLQHRADVDRYLTERRKRVEEAHRINQVAGIRERLESRLSRAVPKD
jgi:uncharacterized protein (DUF433 family)